MVAVPLELPTVLAESGKMKEVIEVIVVGGFGRCLRSWGSRNGRGLGDGELAILGTREFEVSTCALMEPQRPVSEWAALADLQRSEKKRE